MGKSDEAGSINLGLSLSKDSKKKMLKQVNAIGSEAGNMLGSKMIKGLTGMFGTVALTKFAKECIDLGSNLSEVQNVVDTTFTTMNDSLNKWAKNALTDFGLSETYAKQYAATLGSMSKAMGLTESQAYSMGTSVTKLAGDVASFYNLNASEAYGKLKGIWTGETEALKDLGVVMTQTALDQYAFNNGFGKTTVKMTEQEKLMLRYQYVTSSLAAASGDFAKTQDSWANQTKVLSLRFESLKATLGQGLINVLTPVLQLINKLVGGLQTLAEGFSTLTENMFGKADAGNSLSNLATSAVDVSTGIDGITSSAVAAQRELAGFDKMTKLGSDDSSSGSSSSISIPEADTSATSSVASAASPVSGILGNLKEQFSEFESWCGNNFGTNIKTGLNKIIKSFSKSVSNINKAWKDITSLAKPLKDVMAKEMPGIINEFISLATTKITGLVDSVNMIFSDLWNGIAVPFMSKFITEGIPRISEFVTQFIGLLDVINTKTFEIFGLMWDSAIFPLIENLFTWISDLGAVLAEFWDKHGNVIFENLKEAVSTLGDTFSNIWNDIIKPVFDVLMEVLNDLWTNHIKPLVANILDTIGELVNGVLVLWNNTLAPIINWLSDVFGPLFKSVFKTAFTYVSNMIQQVVGFFGGLITSIKGVIQFITGVFTGDWEKAWEGVKNIFSGIWDSLVSLVKVPINSIIDLINGMLDGFTEGVNSMIRAINKISFTVPDWVPGIGGDKFGFDLSTFSAPQIPRLAEGAYVKPNTPQLAMIGDNLHQGELVAPEDKLKAMAMDAVRAASGNNYSLEILKTLKEILAVLKALDLDIVIDGKKLKDIIVQKINEHTVSTGVCEIIL